MRRNIYKKKRAKHKNMQMNHNYYNSINVKSSVKILAGNYKNLIGIVVKINSKLKNGPWLWVDIEDPNNKDKKNNILKKRIHRSNLKINN